MKNYKDFERLVANRLKIFFPAARRGLQFQDGDYQPDVVGTPFYVECKTGKKDLQIAMGSNHVRHFNMEKPDQVEALYQYYYNRMKKWRDENNGKDLPVIIVWKYNNKHKTWVTLETRLYLELKGTEADAGTTYSLLTTIDFVEFQDLLRKTYD